MIYDVRDMVIAQELEGPAEVAVQQLIFSNKGIFLAASWAGHDTCRIYSLHKNFSFTEIKQENVPINTLTFDYYGMYLAIGTAQNMTISSYKNWKKILIKVVPFAEGGVQAIKFDASGRKIFVANTRAEGGGLKTLSLP